MTDSAGFNEDDLNVVDWVDLQRKKMAEPGEVSSHPFAQAIERAGQALDWQITEVVTGLLNRKWFHLRDSKRAVVEFARGYSPFVLIDPSETEFDGERYWFALERLHEHRKHQWSWAEQIGRKNWAAAEHIAFLCALCDVLPTSKDVALVCRRSA